MDNKKKRIGLFGGSFNPVHLGHVNLAIELKEKCSLDEVWFIPTKITPFKLKETLALDKHRLAMVRLAISDIPDFQMLDIEVQREGPSYTIDTVEILLQKSSFEGFQFYLMIGDDALSRFHEWHRAEELVAKVSLLIGKREGTEGGIPSAASPSIRKALTRGIVRTAQMEISATHIRERFRQGRYCGHLVSTKVLDYIIHYGLYLKPE